MAKILDKIMETQALHANRLEKHDDDIDDIKLAIHGHAQNNMPGLIHTVGVLQKEVANHKEILKKFLWMLAGATAVGTIVGTIMHFVIKYLEK